MQANLILGNNIDTEYWIKLLVSNDYNDIFILDYDCTDTTYKNGYMYLNPSEAKKYLQHYEKINFYKSMYIFPGSLKKDP